jgi:transglutaminase-like putative cysteine protease
VAAVVGAATLVRILHGPAGLQVLAMMAALLLVLTWLFPSGGEIASLIPTLDTFEHFNALFVQSGEEIRNQAVPVRDLDGLLLLATTGIGLVGVLVDLAAVGIRRPALAGLPMLAIYSVPVAVLPDGVSFVSFALAGTGFLWLLVSDSVDRVRRFGRRFSGEGRGVEIWEPSPLSAAGRRLGVIGIIAAILVPLAVPTMTSTLMDKFGTGPGGLGPGPGGPGAAPATVDMNAMLSDNLNLHESFEMVRVRTNDPSPYYLRLGVAEQISTEGFSATPPSGSRIPADLPFPVPVEGVTMFGPYQAEVEVTGLSLGLAPIYPFVTGIDGLDSNWSLDEDTGQVFSTRRDISGSTYRFEYLRANYSASLLRTAGPIATADEAVLPLILVPQYDPVTDLVRELTAGAQTQYDKVRALYDYFSTENGFRYSLATIEGDSGSAIVDFLENKRGFCVQYAAGLAWLVREAGFPARVAFGFTRGNGVRDGVSSLTNQNLHAWTEVYFPGFGWVPFDATPGTSVPGSTRTTWAPDPNEDPDDDPTAAPSPGVTAGPLPSVNPGQEPGFEEGEGPTGGNQSIAINSWHIAGAAAAVVLLIILFAPSARRRALRRNRRARTGSVIALTPAPPGQEDLVTDPAAMSQAQRDAHAAWAELLDTMIDYGVLVDPSETPRATAGRLATTPQLASYGRPQTAVLARAEERARYAPTPVRPTNLDEAVQAARKAFEDEATRWQRISARLFPKSVLMRWRLGWFRFVATSVRRTGRVRDALLLVDLRRRRRQ